MVVQKSERTRVQKGGREDTNQREMGVGGLEARRGRRRIRGGTSHREFSGGAQVSTAPQWGAGEVEVCSGRWKAEAHLGQPLHTSIPEAFGGLSFPGHGK